MAECLLSAFNEPIQLIVLSGTNSQTLNLPHALDDFCHDEFRSLTEPFPLKDRYILIRHKLIIVLPFTPPELFYHYRYAGTDRHSWVPVTRDRIVNCLSRAWSLFTLKYGEHHKQFSFR